MCFHSMRQRSTHISLKNDFYPFLGSPSLPFVTRVFSFYRLYFRTNNQDKFSKCSSMECCNEILIKKQETNISAI